MARETCRKRRASSGTRPPTALFPTQRWLFPGYPPELLITGVQFRRASRRSLLQFAWATVGRDRWPPTFDHGNPARSSRTALVRGPGRAWLHGYTCCERKGSHVSAIQALASREPAAARDGQNMAMPDCSAGSPPPAGQCCGLRVLKGRPDQVRAARQLVREHLADHPAAGDASLLASELASNSVMHSASRFGGGRFLIRVTALDGQLAAVTVTDQGGPFTPQETAPDGESGRGLAVVRALACLFRVHDHDGLRTFTAIVAGPNATAPDPQGAPGPLTARTPAATRSPDGTRVHDRAT